MSEDPDEVFKVGDRRTAIAHTCNLTS
jgi:hypothetical protein